jgi:hypothetical protein
VRLTFRRTFVKFHFDNNRFLREKKRERERDELWKRMDALEVCVAKGELKTTPRILELTPLTSYVHPSANASAALPVASGGQAPKADQEGTSPGNKSPKTKKTPSKK